MSPQRRTALVSVAAAVVLIAVKLASGLTSGSLGLVAEAVHSGTDLVAALLTFFAVGLIAIVAAFTISALPMITTLPAELTLGLRSKG